MKFQIRRLGVLGLVLGLALPGIAHGDELWVLPNDVTQDAVGNWAVSDGDSVYFTVAIPDDLDAFGRAVILAMGTDGKSDGDTGDEADPGDVVELLVELSVSANGLPNDDYAQAATVQATLTNGVLTEIDISSLLDIH